MRRHAESYLVRWYITTRRLAQLCSPTNASELEKLFELKEKGVISEDEYKYYEGKDY